MRERERGGVREMSLLASSFLCETLKRSEHLGLFVSQVLVLPHAVCETDDLSVAEQRQKCLLQMGQAEAEKRAKQQK